MAPLQIHEQDTSLLILPPLPVPLTQRSLWSAYRSTFETLLPKVARPGTKAVSRLDIAVTLPASRTSTSRTASYNEDQFAFQEIYTLVCLAAAHTQTDLDFPGGVDARVLLVTISKPDGTMTSNPGMVEGSWVSGPVVDLESLVVSGRSYNHLYGVDGEEGESVLQTFLHEYRNQRRRSLPISRLPSGPSMTIPTSTTSTTESSQSIKHHNVAVGGTFDHLHLGHKLLLTATVYLSDPVSDPSGTRPETRTITIGITGDELLVNKKHPQHLESWETRQQRTHEFINSVLNFYPSSSSSSSSLPAKEGQLKLAVETVKIDQPGPNGKIVRVIYTLSDPQSQGDGGNISQTMINYTQISDPFGPTITDEEISALIISAETRQGGQAVNDKRREKKWKELEVFEVGVLDVDVDVEEDGNGDDKVDGQERQQWKQKENFDGKISSTEIRRRLVQLESTTSSDDTTKQPDGTTMKIAGGEKL